MEINYKWGPVMATSVEKEEIETKITEFLFSHQSPLPQDGIINISLFPDEPRDFKILGVATNDSGKLLFKLMLSGKEYPLSVHYDFSFESARVKYKPDIVKYLLIAETPPKSDSNRFFYFEDVMDHDSLFLETMKVLYPKDTSQMDAREIRNKKATFLLRFKKCGFYLIDSLEAPFERRYSSSQKVRLIRNGQTDLLSRINSIKNENTKVILISATVFEADLCFLRDNGINVINEEFIDFPVSGGQIRFRNKMNKILTGHNNNSLCNARFGVNP